MAKKKSSKLLNGILIGGALGVAAGIFASSKTGKKLRKEAEDKMAEFYASAAPKLKKMKRVGEAEYKAFMKKALADYKKKNGKLTAADLKKMAKDAEASWKHLKKNL